MTLLDDRTTAPPRSGRMRILDRTGDTTITWDPDNADEVEIARSAFAAAQGKGYLAYKVTEEGRGEQLREFDETAGEIVMSPQLVGG